MTASEPPRRARHFRASRSLDAAHSPALMLRMNTVSVVVASAVLLGLALRLVQFAANRSLWFDEAMLTLNILHRSAVGLAATLDFNQVAPIGFLETEKLVTHTLGASEPALRLLPLVLGLASVPLFALLAVRTLAPAAAALATLVFACAPGAVYYSSEVKQYSGDVAVGIALLVFGIALLDPSTSRRGRVAVGLVGAALVPLSTASVFVVGGVAATLAVRLVVNRDRQRVEAAAAVGVWLMSALALVVFTATRSTRLESALGGGGSLYPHGAVTDGQRQWAARVASGIWRSTGFPDSAPERYLHWPLTGLAAVGLISLARRKPAEASMICLPFVVMTVASALHRYPVFDRTVLFLAPAWLLLVAAGAAAVVAAARARPARDATAAVLAAAVAVVPLVHAASNAANPIEHEEVKSALVHIRSHWRPGDTLFVDSDTRFVMRYYLECRCLRAAEVRGPGRAWQFGTSSVRDGSQPEPLRSAPPRFVVGELAVRSLGEFLRQLGGSRPTRFWLLYSHTSSPTDDQQVAALVHELDRRATRLDAYRATGARAYLYDLRVTRR